MAPGEAGKWPFAAAGCGRVGGGAGKWSGLLAARRRVGGVSASGDGCVRPVAVGGGAPTSMGLPVWVSRVRAAVGPVHKLVAEVSGCISKRNSGWRCAGTYSLGAYVTTRCPLHPCSRRVQCPGGLEGIRQQGAADGPVRVCIRTEGAFTVPGLVRVGRSGGRLTEWVRGGAHQKWDTRTRKCPTSRTPTPHERTMEPACGHIPTVMDMGQRDEKCSTSAALRAA